MRASNARIAPKKSTPLTAAITLHGVVTLRFSAVEYKGE
jgi:hypothetical protein